MKGEIDLLRNVSRKLVRELGMLQVDELGNNSSHQTWHSLIEISKDNHATVSKISNLLVISLSSASRIVATLVKEGFVNYESTSDRREKYLRLTELGTKQLKLIDEFSNTKIKGAFEILSSAEQENIVNAIGLYADALELNRKKIESIKISKLTKSSTLRKQIVSMIENIQIKEFGIAITPDINECIIKAEDSFYFNDSCNFWYAEDGNGKIIGSIGLKKINENEVEIKKVFVEKSFRGMGIAQKLIKTALNAANKNGFKYAYLGTVNVLEAAINFYTKLGFNPISKEVLPKDFDICILDTNFFKGEISRLV